MKCPTRGCDGYREESHVCCKSCWSAVTNETRRLVWRGYDKDRFGKRHIAAIKKARAEAQEVFDCCLQERE